MTYAVTLTPEITSPERMHLRWSVENPSAPIAEDAPRILHSEHPEVVRQNLRQIGLGDADVEDIMSTGATVEMTQAQMADLGILLDRAELSEEEDPLLS